LLKQGELPDLDKPERLRALETGGASLAARARNLLNDLR
jgi:hypothetical protein